ncbi:Pre-mRNA-processing factor 17 [Exophiala dermatitidis]
MSGLLGAAYESSDDESGPAQPTPALAKPVNTAPDVSTEVRATSLEHRAGKTDKFQDHMQTQIMLANPTSTALSYNVTYDNLSRPSQGPANPYKPSSGNVLKRKNVLTGNAEETAMSEATFKTQHRTFQSLGYTRDPSLTGGFVGDQSAVAKFGGKDVVELRPSKRESAAIRAKRQKKGDSSIVDGEGAYMGPWAKYQTDDVAYEELEAAADQELASDEEWVEEGIAPPPLPPPPKEATAYSSDSNTAETTEFHGESEFDYQGRTYMHVPQDLDIDLRKEPGSVQNFVPKKLIHVYKYHTKPITSLRFIPRSSHLLLSSSADAKLALWDAHHDRTLLRTFSGHKKAITDTDFHPTGRSFLSASYDRQMKLWDTETGKVISRFTTGKTPHTLRFHPEGNEFIAGMSDKKIVQFDTRSGELTQEYDHHLGPINTLTFVDEGRRFISTSDDKSLRAWEYGIPVPIKFVADPSMYALVRAAPHPSGKYVAFQSADNQIVVYAAGDKFRQNRKKAFRGHNTSGYAIDVAISPDGGIISSGDTGGFVCFWDWKTGKMWHKIQAGGESKGAVTCVAWHQQETSKVATGGLDGVIRYWD